MLRASVCTLSMLALFGAGLVCAEDLKKGTDKDKQHEKGTITKIDSNKNSVTISVKNHDGKRSEKTLPLASSAAYLDQNGKSAKVDAFHSGDHVRITESDGKITELKKCADRTHATIKSVDAGKGTVAVMMKNHDGKETEKTFHVDKDVRYLDQNGKTVKFDTFHDGDYVRITEKDGKIAELKKCEHQAQAKITKMDPDKGTVTVMMKDKNGKESTKVFTLTEESEYVDSTGQIAAVDVFQSGDEVLIIEADGQISELKKHSKDHKSGDKSQKSVEKKTSGT